MPKHIVRLQTTASSFLLQILTFEKVRNNVIIFFLFFDGQVLSHNNICTSTPRQIFTSPISLVLFFDASFCLFYFFSNTNFTEKL